MIIPRLHDRLAFLVPGMRCGVKGNDYDLISDWQPPAGEPIPSFAQLLDVTDEQLDAEQVAQDARVNDAVAKLLNNAALIRQAMTGIPEARAALDAIIAIDTSTNAAAIESMATRQAAVLFLAANALRAAVTLAKRGDLPPEIIEAFLQT